MSLHTQGLARERILLLGGAKVGKTTAYLSIARRCPDSQMFVLDSDCALDRMLDDDDIPNVKVTSIEDWTGYVEGVRESIAAMTTYVDEASGKTLSNDWLVIDFLSGAWEAVQSWYIEKRYGKSIEDYFTQFELARKSKKETALDGDTDWGVINKNHKALMTMIKRCPGHVLATATARAVGERDDPSLKSTYAAAGSRPEGQKHLSHDFHTLIVLKKSRMGEYQMTSAGDRKRQLVENAPVSDFALNYLVGLAGWRP